MMLLRMDDWNAIRGEFSEEEKSLLNAAIAGVVLCPRGCVINEAMLGKDLAEKLKVSLMGGRNGLE